MSETARRVHFVAIGGSGMGTLAGLLGRTEADLRARFDAMIETVRDEKRYTAWLLFAVSGVKG